MLCFTFSCSLRENMHYLSETATNSAKTHSLARKSEHLRTNQIQRFLHFNQHSITFLGIHLRHSTNKREKFTFINANIRVINIILKNIRDNRQTFKFKRYSLTFLRGMTQSVSVKNSGAHSFRCLGSEKLLCFFNFPVSRARPERIV